MECKYAYTAIAILVWKLIPSVTWSGKTSKGKTFYLGLGSGYIFWQPQCLIFKNVDFKIGFFCLEHRTWEVVPRMVQAYMFDIDFFSDNTEDCQAFWCGVLGWPLAFSIVTMKWKCLIMNWVSITEIVCSMIRWYFGYNEKDKLSDWSTNPFFSQKAYEKANWKHYLWLGFFPRLTVDMSYFLNKDEDEKPVEF